MTFSADRMASFRPTSNGEMFLGSVSAVHSVIMMNLLKHQSWLTEYLEMVCPFLIYFEVV